MVVKEKVFKLDIEVEDFYKLFVTYFARNNWSIRREGLKVFIAEGRYLVSPIIILVFLIINLFTVSLTLAALDNPLTQPLTAIKTVYFSMLIIFYTTLITLAWLVIEKHRVVVVYEDRKYRVIANNEISARKVEEFFKILKAKPIVEKVKEFYEKLVEKYWDEWRELTRMYLEKKISEVMREENVSREEAIKLLSLR